MHKTRPVFDQINLVVTDMEPVLQFYRLLGIEIATPHEWPPGSGALHTDAEFGSASLEFDNVPMAKIWHAGWREARGGKAVLSFSFPSREAVDACYAQLTAAGHAGLQPPYDAFWGARYAIVRDPEGNDVGLMSPIDPKLRSVPAIGD